MGSRPSGGPWRVGIADPDDPERIGLTLEAVDRAVATSGAYGFRFDRQGASTICWTLGRVCRPACTAA